MTDRRVLAFGDDLPIPDLRGDYHDVHGIPVVPISLARARLALRVRPR